MKRDDHLNMLDDLVRNAKRAGADAADAIAITGQSLSVDWRGGALEQIERSEGFDIGLRVIIGEKQAGASTSDQSPQSLAALVERVMAMANAVPVDPTAGLADASQLAADWPDLDLEDGEEPAEATISARAAQAEAAMLAVDGVSANSDGAGAGWGRAEVAVVASNGFSAQYARTSSSVTAVALAGDGLEMETRHYGHSAVHASDLDDVEEIGREAADRAVRSLGARKVESQQVPIIFDRRVSASLIGHLAAAANGQSIARGTSFLLESLGERVFRPGVSIIDDPRRNRGLASKPFDGEGLACERIDLVDDGVLQCWLLNLASARQLGLESNGRATRSIGSAPGIGTTNLYMQPGSDTPEALVSGIKQGLLVTGLIGPGVNLVTGTYSRGCTGFWIENGEIAYPVSEITIAGTLPEMFASAIPADDLEFRGGTNAPSMLIEGMTVAGA